MSLRLVKGLVIAMSAALVVGFVVLMVGLARQATRIAEPGDAAPFRSSLNLAEGAVIVSVTGSADRVAVLVERPDDAWRG